MGTSLGVTLGLALLFSLIRPRNSVVYAPKLKHADKQHAPPPLGKGVFSWLKPIIKTSEGDNIDRIGMDATIFLRFTRMCRNVFLILSVLGCAIMIPVNMTQSEKSRSTNENILLLMTPQYVHPQALWANVVCAWIFDIVVGYFLWHNYRAVRNLRRRYFQSTEFQKSLHARSVMVTHIPPAYRTDEGLLRLTDEVNPTPSIPRSAIGRNVKDLPKLIQEHEDAVRQLEVVLAKYFKNPDRLPPNRPTCKPAKGHTGGRPGEKVDAIDYLTDRIRDLEMEIKHVRESIDKRNAMSYGFASWDNIEHAHAVAFAARKKHPQGTNITLAPRPNDIIWANLALTKSNLRQKRFLNVLWTTLLTVIWIAPNAMIAVFLTDLSHLGLVWQDFQTSLEKNPKTWAAVQGIAAPAVTSLVYLILPIIFRRLAIRAGKKTKTSRELHVIHSLYAFFVFNNLVVFSIFSAVWQFVAAVVEASNKHQGVWDAIRSAQFYTKTMIALCQVSPFWIMWLLQRNLGAAIDLSQLINMFGTFFARKFRSPTPRRSIEWTAPPPFDYASYYNYFLFYATIALTFASLQPIVLPVTALYFTIDSWLKKYLLMYIFTTKTESGGQYWRVIFNRLVFALVFANCITALIVIAKGTWTMVFVLVPLPFIMIAFKWYCRKTFDFPMKYYNRAILTDSEAMANGKSSKRSVERLSSRFGHPALYRPLMTPMVHAKAADALEKIFQGRQGMGGAAGEYSDIAMHTMSSSEPGRAQPRGTDADATAPFEVVPENQLDFEYYKNRSDFREDFGGGIYGRPDDLISERSHTPGSYMVGGVGSPGSSRASSPAPSYNPHLHQPMASPYGRPPLVSEHPAFQSSGPDGQGFYTVNNESETRLLSQPGPVASSGDVSSLHRWASEDSARQQSPSRYEPYRERRV